MQPIVVLGILQVLVGGLAPKHTLLQSSRRKMAATKRQRQDKEMTMSSYQERKRLTCDHWKTPFTSTRWCCCYCRFERVVFIFCFLLFCLFFVLNWAFIWRVKFEEGKDIKRYDDAVLLHIKRCQHNILLGRSQKQEGLVWLVGFYGISTFVGYLMPNLFLYK